MEMPMSKSNRARAGALALSALLLGASALSCTKGLGDSPAAGEEKGSIAATPSASATPTAHPTPRLPTSSVVLPNTAAPGPSIETPVTAPSPAVLEAANLARGKLDGLTAGIPGTKVRFVDCSVTASCTTRLEAQSLTGLRDLLQAVSREQGGVGFVVREQLDAYTGRTFTADVTLGGGQTRPVPTDENELLVPSDS
jgi:hypothetical protein